MNSMNPEKSTSYWLRRWTRRGLFFVSCVGGSVKGRTTDGPIQPNELEPYTCPPIPGYGLSAATARELSELLIPL